MNEEEKKLFEGLVNPILLREAVISSAMFSLCYEMVKNAIVGRPQSLFSQDLGSLEPVLGEEYEKAIKSKHRNVLIASLEWLYEAEVLDQGDMEAFLEARSTRNKISHEMPKWLFEGGAREVGFRDQLVDLVQLFEKIEAWWNLTFEVPANPDFDGRQVDEEDIQSGSVILMKMLLSIALGNENESGAYLAFLNQKKS